MKKNKKLLEERDKKPANSLKRQEVDNDLKIQTERNLQQKMEILIQRIWVNHPDVNQESLKKRKIT